MTKSSDCIRSVRRTARSAFLLCPLLAIAATSCAASAAPASTSPASMVATPPEAAALARALDSVSADEIRSDVFFIASDELGGRDTPSEGLRIAARYLRARLERLGWKPGAKDGYFYEYPLAQKRLDFAASHVEVAAGDRTLRLLPGTDYFLGRYDVWENEAAGEAVWCGAGEEKDFPEKLAGKWAVCEDRDASTSKLARLARKAGAVGLAIVEAPDAKEPYAARYRMDELRRGTVEYPRAQRSGGEERERRASDRTPSVRLGRAAFERALATAGKAPASLAAGEALGFALRESRKLDPATTIQVENVCGFWPGSDPELAKEVILVTAHYDHVGTNARGEIHNGADDNGSGTAGLLAIAQALVRYGPMRRSVMLMWVSGEEKGLWGSKAWNDRPWLPDGCRAVCDLNIDMIGRNAPDKLLITPTEERKEHNGLVVLAEQLAPLEGFPELGSADEYYERSDHINFARNGIPAAFLFSDVHADYHKPTDDPEKVDTDKVRRVVRLVLRMLDGLQKDALGV